ncbi:hypothetical protein CCHL11_09428 [Colletotrichum chlorophyti]|uniref:Wings apart-like protein C-terminal domain-containing protein n=1 Tax=Colletotrichum chlorophyti TaxID=708187 RepID=A0A1Q8S1U7_9PEZI|nr:hypothetical protein CCHL11_09428 [Colletotrichum chlorophyti]
MATRDGPSVPRKKTATYGKTSRKRPIHAFLDLSSGSRRAAENFQAVVPSSKKSEQIQNMYDPPSDDEPVQPTPRRDARVVETTETQPDGSRSSKKRRTYSAVAPMVDRKPTTESTAIFSQAKATASSQIRRAKSPFGAVTTVEPLRIDNDETTTPELKKANNPRQIESRPTSLHSRVKVEVQPSATKPRRGPEPRRIRLIDQLAAQTEDSSEYESDTSDELEKSPNRAASSDASISTPIKQTEMTPKLSARPKQLLSTRKFRSTYGQQRTLKADENGGDGFGSQVGFESSQHDLTPPPAMSKLSSFAFEEEEIEEETSSKGGGIIDIHALRQAGANHRFADSMSDLLDRIGKPQPLRSQPARSRRTALLELASKLRDKTFVRQFRDQGAKDALFQAIGEEEDIFSGFALLSVLLVLFTSHSVPHLVPQLQAEGIAQLASKMFEIEEDIVAIAGQRKSNLSRNAQASLGNLRLTLQQLDLWKGTPPTLVSPRTIALKTLSVLCHDGDSPVIQDILSGLTDQLFGFVETGWEQSRADGMTTTNGGISLSLLEGYSIAAMQSEAGPRWTQRYLPILADILTAAMARPMGQFADFESTTLKLTLNTTNNNPTAASAFSRGELFRELAESSVSGFELLQQSVRKGAFSNGVYETLMLMLGVMINISEHCPSTRQSVDSWQGPNGSPLDKLMDVYLENRESVGTD